MPTYNAWMLGGPWDQLMRSVSDEEAAVRRIDPAVEGWSGHYVRDAMKPLEWVWEPSSDEDS